MNAEFKRQLHQLESLMLSNQTSLQTTIQSSMSSLRQESFPAKRIKQTPHHWVRPLHNTSHSIPARNKKLYPLPQFTGQPEEWQIFYEAFTSTTEEFEYSNLHNIMRLREALKEEALETVDSLLASSNNMDAIMEILEEMFGDRSNWFEIR